ncbi:RcnB family protein [Diaphorobacter ruginosibacter]|uniref:RcnB family protein n=1 Tax=Diaphorobacter ruginosibacter TaxID=1715720 RepID=A0A7G9RM79_9BURK|nr:RcnB family protein [Diaphorobacter ruginosibacter]QNN56704.1 RcnB family protein [Diaphorobacter ruginosibacter]
MTAKIRIATRTFTAAAVALVLGVTTLGTAFAQPARPDITRNDHRDHDRRGHDDRRGYDRHDNRRPNPPGHVRNDHYPRGAGPDHRWHRGDRIPPAYRTRSYVVEDWRTHRLTAPPRGYQWVQYGSDYLLVAIATGVIASLILSN